MLADHALWRPGAPDGLGDLHLGRAGKRDGALGGTFVTLAGTGDLANGLLPDRETAPGGPPSEGTAVAVRIARAPQGGKGVRVSARLDAAETLAFAGRLDGAPRLVRRGPNPLDELLARWPATPWVVPSPALAARLAPRTVRIDPVPDEATETALDALRANIVAVPGGARATIHPTPALVAIDVDTGTGRQTSMLAANRALLPVLLHQIRLRNLSGAIVIDLAGLSARKRALLAPDIAAALAPDPLRPRFLGFTALGLVEIVRARRRPPLHELFSGPHAAALDAAASLAARQEGGPSRAFGLRVGPVLGRTLAEDAAIMSDLALATGRSLVLRVDPTLGPEAWEVEDAKGPS